MSLLLANPWSVTLIQGDDGRITGVIAKNADGGYIQCNASKGVVLATGGYEFNWERLKKCLRPRDLQVRAWVNSCMGNTGDGHEMGLAVGAFEDEYPHALCTDPSGTKSGGAFGAAIHPFMRVNDYGLRFVNESIPSNFLANAINAQVGAHDWVITDANIASNIDKIRDLTIPGVTPEQEAEGFIADSVSADTLEKLAEQMGVNPATFVATVNRYNELCDKGSDDDFGVPTEKLAPVTTPPFYACDEGQINLATECGLRVNSDSAVLSLETNAPIPGLYAVGTCSGSMFYGTYPHHCSGISLGRGLTYGMIVGRILSGTENPVNDQ
ncbi:FAD-binding protein [Adlercreutzia sp. ZJ138]|uniref:FAD-binding protein n=1 Tax=Adlercreutzia sp. ZJ138 TaxID=2709405 RepID=UPI0013EAAC96